MKTCLIVPVFNHENAIANVIEKLKVFELPCFLVNDGSSIACSQVLADCADKESSWLTLITRQENGGKGAAVIDGFTAAIRQGFNYAIQIDADGQHDTNVIPEFLAASKQHPNAIILGQPIFDASVPKNRLYGRQVTNIWIAINTLSFAIADGMCGFRLYPLAAVNRLISNTSIGQRMDFDIDIVVRLYWQGVNVVNLPTAVRYPIDGVSHFRLWRDNLMISLTHARLFFGMLIRIPQLLLRHWR
ncbi:glycosyltransferase family 2 protein [Methyloglobulus sp.]|uniref:glycosyltransferase family 2 protein n=1 Tax=Methyloglobulus sp. TaxID=2518622 RepID=UPI0032B81FF4